MHGKTTIKILNHFLFSVHSLVFLPSTSARDGRMLSNRYNLCKFPRILMSPTHDVRQRLYLGGNQLHGLTTAIVVLIIATATTTLILTWKLRASSASSEVFTQLLGSTEPTDEAKSRWLIFFKWLNLQATNRLKQTLITSLLLHYKQCNWPTHFLWRLLWTT
jgi:hypothetical protein